MALNQNSKSCTEYCEENLENSVCAVANLLLKDYVKKKNTIVSAERTWQMKVEEMRMKMRDNPYRPTALLLSALDETACK